MSDGSRRFELPERTSSARAGSARSSCALERYFAQESPHPHPWVLAGRVDATGLGALQVRHLTDGPWEVGGRVPFLRRGVPPSAGRGDIG